MALIVITTTTYTLNMSLPDTALSPSYRDVNKLKQILLTKLPYELVDLILEEAQYWTYISTERNSFSRIRSSSSLIFNAKQIISISESIPERAKVKLVQFRLNSQEYRTGYSSRRSAYPYDSFTWFEASIPRPMYIHQPLPRAPINLGGSLDASTLHQLGWAKIANPPDERNRRWRVQANATLPHPQVHQVTWVRMYQVGNIPFEDEFDAMTGKDSGLGFVESLRAGDRIALVGRALFAGHENCVFGTKIEFACHS